MASKNATCSCGQVVSGETKICARCKGEIPVSKKKAKKTYLPLDIVAPLLERLVKERNFRDVEGYEGGKTVLSAETGVAAKPLYDILHGLRESVSFDTVDKILTNTGNFDLWYEEPFCHYYDGTKSSWRGSGGGRQTDTHCVRCKAPLPGRSKRRTGLCVECLRKERAKKTKTCGCGKEIEYRSATCWECRWKKPRVKGKKELGFRRSHKKFFIHTGT